MGTGMVQAFAFEARISSDQEDVIRFQELEDLLSGISNEEKRLAWNQYSYKVNVKQVIWRISYAYFSLFFNRLHRTSQADQSTKCKPEYIEQCLQGFF
jgi:hypothetical protein